MKWLVLDDDEKYIHVVPESDIKPHGYPVDNKQSADLEDVLCPCKPKIKQENGKLIVIHNSFEQSEAIQESLKNIIV